MNLITGTIMRSCKLAPINCLLQRRLNDNTKRLFTGYYRCFKTNGNRRNNFDIINGGGGGGGYGPTYNPNLWKAFMFTATFSFGTFTIVSIWEYERKVGSRRMDNFWNSMDLSKKNSSNTSSEISLTNLISQLKHEWNRISIKDKVFLPICAINCAVFALWRFKRIHPLLIEYFTSNPFAKTYCVPMICSMFSHYTLWHLFANMFVLNSFSAPAVYTLGSEQFMLVYLCSGVFSNLTSSIYKVLTSQVGRSLGASGAIMGILAYICTKYPDQQLSIIFLPAITFTAGAAIKCLVAVDLVGCALRWRFFDHAAHLGGAVIGISWYYFGEQIWSQRKIVQRYWHQLRTTIT